MYTLNNHSKRLSILAIITLTVVLGIVLGGMAGVDPNVQLPGNLFAGGKQGIDPANLFAGGPQGIDPANLFAGGPQGIDPANLFAGGKLGIDPSNLYAGGIAAIDPNNGRG